MGTKRLTREEKLELENSLLPNYKIHWLESFTERFCMARLLFKSALTPLVIREGYELHSQIIDWRKQFSIDKIPAEALGIDILSTHFFKWALKSWKRYNLITNTFKASIFARFILDFIPALFSSALFVIYHEQNSSPMENDIEDGMATQKFWLTADKLKLGLQPKQVSVIFSNYLKDGTKFSNNHNPIKNVEETDKRLKSILPQNVFKNKVFMGRIGRTSRPKSRSLRVKLDDLIL